MWKVLFRARDRFVRDQRGHVAMLFAFSAIPLVGLLGGAVDMTRYTRHKAAIANAMDSAAIALARRGAKDDEDADDFVNKFIAAALPNRDAMLHLGAFDATQTERGWRVTATGSMDTAFMPVIGIDEMLLDLETEVGSAGNYEIALVLDNTGSMAANDKIVALRAAATDLVATLYKDEARGSRVKTALVPFVTTVNIKGDAFDPSWITPTGSGPYSDQLFDKPFDRVKFADQLGFGWKGCVEARLGNTFNDAAPTSTEAKWVPYFWPDEPDDGGYGNSYLKDSGGGGDEWAQLSNIGKYDDPEWEHGGRSSLGPNKGCAEPIVELTSDTERMETEIGKMRPNNASGTNIAEGLAWGWRVLSPGAPFNQGAPYDDPETKKVLVLLSDGVNDLVERGGVTGSDYTGFGYLAQGRLGTKKSKRRAMNYLNERVAEMCESIKGAARVNANDPDSIRVYMILLQVNDAATEKMFEECASKGKDEKPLYYYAPDNAALALAFKDIGDDITTLHLSR